MSIPRASQHRDSEAELDTVDPPCDFADFVGQRRGISRQEAEQLIEGWIVHYCPRTKPAIVIETGPHAAREVQSYDICA